MSNLFAGIEDVERDNGDGGGTDTFLGKDGDYVLEVDKFVAFTSQSPSRKGQLTVVMEATVMEVLSGGDDSHRKGQRVKVIECCDRNRDDSFTPKGGHAMARVKAMSAALLGENGECAPDEAITADVIGELTAEPGEALKGARVVAKVSTRHWTDKNTGKPKSWTNKSWSPLPA